MVAVKSNISARNIGFPKVAVSSRIDKINNSTQARNRPIARKLSNNEMIGASKEVGTLATKTQHEPIAVIPIAEGKPVWLRSLMGLQTASSIVTLLVVTATLAIYGGTIYGQAKWSEEYQKLEKLRRYQQQLSVANELLKHEIAEQAASPDVGLVPLDSIEPIFLSPAPQRSAPEDSNSESETDRQSAFEMPLSY